MDKNGESRIYPGRLYHRTPSWVRPGASFHIRLRTGDASRQYLTEERVARPLLSAAEHYHLRGRWYCHLFLLMPDHLHAILTFPRDNGMSRIVGDWKAYAARTLGVCWQPNYFDHRIRPGGDFSQTIEYIRRNPVVKGLCANPEDWPWIWELR